MIHHWSGWPGAFCLHCGQPDLWEIAIGRGFYDPYNERWDNSNDANILKEAIENNTCSIEYSESCPQCNWKQSAK